MPGLYYEEFEVGHVFKHHVRRTITEMDNILFSAMTMSTQPLHMDFEFCKTTRWKKPLVHSIFTLGTVMGLAVQDTTYGTTLANLGMSLVKFPTPVFHGDTIRSETKVVSKRVSNSIAGTGIVEFEHRGFNQRDEVVAICVRAGLIFLNAAEHEKARQAEMEASRAEEASAA